MSRGRFGSFKKGKKIIFDSWNSIRSASFNDSIPQSISDISYASSQGIWNIDATSAFPKKELMSLEYLNYFDSIENASSYTFSGINLSAISEKDTLIVVVQYGESSVRTLSSVTISGSPCIIDFDQNTGGMNTNFARMYNRKGRSSESISVSISGGSTARCRIVLYKISNYFVSVHETNSVSAASGTGSSISLNIPANSVSLLGDFHGTQGTTTSWLSGEVITDLSADIESLSYAAVGKIEARSAQRLGYQISTSHSNSSQTIGLVGIVYSPT